MEGVAAYCCSTFRSLELKHGHSCWITIVEGRPFHKTIVATAMTRKRGWGSTGRYVWPALTLPVVSQHPLPLLIFHIIGARLGSRAAGPPLTPEGHEVSPLEVSHHLRQAGTSADTSTLVDIISLASVPGHSGEGISQSLEQLADSESADGACNRRTEETQAHAQPVADDEPLESWAMQPSADMRPGVREHLVEIHEGLLGVSSGGVYVGHGRCIEHLG
ncbi:uncharacterized protein LOC121269856 [Carcharodon carcharias]|uniref:uncharacterized protein LOC121269856 n=1 Tax=Carcharodon carcharias TaxID=13397 RepID=UPI001B7DB8FF|nr:uncharacterized protein LOC121269856 [Carcharodon carcharias]